MLRRPVPAWSGGCRYRVAAVLLSSECLLRRVLQRLSVSWLYNRLKEQYGDRETVSRNSRYTVRSFVAWGVLKDSAKGCYEKDSPVTILDKNLLILMLEAALYTTPEGKGELGLILNSPAFFPFHFPAMTGDFISQASDRIEVVRYGLDDIMIKLLLN